MGVTIMYQLRKMVYVVLMVILSAAVCCAEPLKVYIAPFNVVGTVKDKDESKILLQALLTAKLANGKILPVTTVTDANVTVQGTYVMIGNQYSLDIVLLSPQNKTLSRRVTSGVNDSPSYFKMLDVIINQIKPDLDLIPLDTINNVGVHSLSTNIRSWQDTKTTSDIIYAKVDSQHENKFGSPRMMGEYSLIRNIESIKALLLADARSIKLIHLGDNKVVADAQLEVGSQIINIDYMSNAMQGIRIIVSYIHMGKAYTAIYGFDGKTMKTVNNKEPFFAKVVKLYGNEESLLVQEQGDPEKPYYGAVYTAKIMNNKLQKDSKVLLPNDISIYEFNQFLVGKNDRLIVAYDHDGYLVVYDNKLSQIWKSSDKFGRSQLSYEIQDLSYLNKIGKEYRTYFVNQRILVTKTQAIIVGYNDPSLSIGDMRTYKKGIVYGFKWNGSALEEVWHTSPTQNYMPDFEYDDTTQSLYQLQRTQGEGLFQKQPAMSSVLIKKVE